jgi:hypothetical protein
MDSSDKLITIIFCAIILGITIMCSVLFITTAKVDINYQLGINLSGVNESLLVETLKKTQPITAIVTEDSSHSSSNYTCIPTEDYVNLRILASRLN